MATNEDVKTEEVPALLDGLPEQPRRRVAWIGGLVQVFFVIFFAAYAGIISTADEFVVRFVLFSVFHVVLFFFFVLSRKFWLVFVTSAASFLTLLIDGIFLWHFWETAGAGNDLWKVSLWLVLKVLPLLCLLFFFFWMRSLEKLKTKQNQVKHV